MSSVLMGEDSNKKNWTYRKEKNFQSQLWPSGCWATLWLPKVCPSFSITVISDLSTIFQLPTSHLLLLENIKGQRTPQMEFQILITSFHLDPICSCPSWMPSLLSTAGILNLCTTPSSSMALGTFLFSYILPASIMILLCPGSTFPCLHL